MRKNEDAHVILANTLLCILFFICFYFFPVGVRPLTSAHATRADNEAPLCRQRDRRRDDQQRVHASVKLYRLCNLERHPPSNPLRQDSSETYENSRKKSTSTQHTWPRTCNHLPPPRSQNPATSAGVSLHPPCLHFRSPPPPPPRLSSSTPHPHLLLPSQIHASKSHPGLLIATREGQLGESPLVTHR